MTNKDRKIVITVQDRSGRPFVAAQVGSNIHFVQDKPDAPRREQISMWFVGDLSEEGEPPPTITDQEGKVEVRWSRLFDEEEPEPVSLVAVDAEASQMGIGALSPDDAAVTLTLETTIPLTINCACSELKGSELVLDWCYMYATRDGKRIGSSGPGVTSVRAFYPPGEYSFDVYGAHTEHIHQAVTLTAGQSSSSVTVDLPATKLARMHKKPAPELKAAKVWRNSAPRTLESLRGKAVILDFWGHWCGPCVQSMPALMELHDKYHERGLVILAIHDDSIENGDELDQQLAELKAAYWNGRALPFPVILDGGHPVSEDGKDPPDRTTTGTYAIRSFPTTILIDPEGIIQGEFGTGLPEDMAKLEAMLSRLP